MSAALPGIPAKIPAPEKIVPEKIAVVLFNLGGPGQEKDIAPFLFNFFMDRNIIALPWLLRWPLARLVSRRRSRREAKEAYRPLGFKSPLLENSQAQAAALEQVLARRGFNARTFVSMRYWHPLSKSVVEDLVRYAPDRLVLLPLYPQFSRTTTGSSFEDFEAALRGLPAPRTWDAEKNITKIRCYPGLEGFIRASAENIRAALAKAPPGTRLLLSAHGLPEKIIAAGDPYQRHCEETAEKIVAALALPGLDWQLCYQSRVGPLRWIGPSLGEALEKAAREKAAGVVVYPHAFVSEHVETLVELDIEYRHRAGALGIPHYGRAKTAGTHPAFIEGLAGLVEEALRSPKNQ